MINIIWKLYRPDKPVFLLTTLPSSVQAAGVPTVPGSDGLVRSPEEAFKVAKEVQHLSYPALQAQAPKT